jgi:hypothetical protein
VDKYRIDYTILRRLDGEDDYTEVGFGSTEGWGTVEQAAHILQSAVENGDWETGDGMPDPSEVAQRA